MRYPEWLRKQLPKARHNQDIRLVLGDTAIHTVCESALCPNRGECFSKKTVTYMILGNSCTRTCRFCAVNKLEPEVLNPEEPRLVAESAKKLGLQHIVITSVTRDDLADGGAAHFAKTIQAVRAALPGATVEVLIPDFQGNTEALDTVLSAQPDVLNHNVETVDRLYSKIRPQAQLTRSLNLLKYAKTNSRSLIKSGFMVGLGETDEELQYLLAQLQSAGVQVVTIGQYLAPSKDHAPVARFVDPQLFSEYKQYGENIGIPYIFSGPFVRSSYMAAEVLMKLTQAEAAR